jgi:hypothetical protein
MSQNNSNENNLRNTGVLQITSEEYFDVEAFLNTKNNINIPTTMKVFSKI